jgi:hypothetical protein
MVISAFNPEVTDLEKSYLLNPYSVGVTAVLVKNSDRFAVNDRIMLGEMGQEKTEVVTVSAVSADGNTITVGATVFSHSADDPVYRLRFDQVRFYRSTTTSTGTYTLISTQNLDVDNADLQTIYDDTTGTSAYFYKTTVYHSISTVESAFSDPIQGSGWRREQVGHIIDEILQEVGDTQEVHVTRTEMLGYFNDVNDDLQTNVARPYTFLHARTTLTQTANQNYINFPTDSNGKQTMWKFDYLDYNFLDSTTTPTTNITYTLKTIPEPEFRNIYQDNTIDATTVSDKVGVVSLDTAVNRFRFDVPFATTAGILYLHYWKYFNVIDSEGDIIETPTPLIYKLYCRAKFYRKRSIADLTLGADAQVLEQAYQIEKARYKGLDRKDQGSARGFRPLTDRITSYQRT